MDLNCVPAPLFTSHATVNETLIANETFALKRPCVRVAPTGARQTERYFAKSKMESKILHQRHLTTNLDLQDSSPYDNTKQGDLTDIPDPSESPFQEFEAPRKSVMQHDITNYDNFEFQGDKPCYSI